MLPREKRKKEDVNFSNTIRATGSTVEYPTDTTEFEKRPRPILSGKPEEENNLNVPGSAF